MGIDLPIIWTVIIGFGLMMYVIMDGFDLGIGLVLPFVKNREERDLMVNTVAPIWDGNETWLVLGGAALMGAFPMAYAVILSALYIPIMIMLAGLIWRGVAFEFRFKADDAHKSFWDKAFIWGSYVATFAQGVTLGAFINGFSVTDGHYSGKIGDWLTPFSLFTGFGLLIAYALLGTTWLIMKTEGDLQSRMRSIGKPIVIILLIVIALVSLWTPLIHPDIAQRWFSMPNLILFAPVPIFVILTAWLLVLLLSKESQASPFILSLFLLFLGYSGLAISIFPNIIPPDISIWQASSPPQSQGFALIGALIIIPFILVYTSWSYWVFRGKVKLGEGYH
ncbi:cytochrome d ubiquinol oxidase subunit II [Bartonella tamiae]|uniref:Cytochrome d ubiquinol oxidase, subunit II n=1 Tax=Bartonella tamiae Th239 TaxID=1094558 RepID=J1K0F3_9HYPH|nr:cytochrome d ubiquinol oxidase subunit II [Bartonella tamiae]EJF90475.1 cytochrome d ubiquinol oxidase, subunit II [Bartonella tamiae Th239]EJF93581.1 cytochrome d ubiquinol oxidase, subunit II [Bartonella tamiae Th307]